MATSVGGCHLRESTDILSNFDPFEILRGNTGPCFQDISAVTQRYRGYAITTYRLCLVAKIKVRHIKVLLRQNDSLVMHKTMGQIKGGLPNSHSFGQYSTTASFIVNRLPPKDHVSRAVEILLSIRAYSSLESRIEHLFR
jgi:hypothetical protein